jgi:hypothetical protein
VLGIIGIHPVRGVSDGSLHNSVINPSLDNLMGVGSNRLATRYRFYSLTKDEDYHEQHHQSWDD